MTVPVDGVGILDEEERFQKTLDVREVLLPVGERQIGLVDEVRGDADLVHPRGQGLPGELVGEDEREVDPDPPVRALEQRRLGESGLRVPAGLPLHDRLRIEPIRVGEFSGHRDGLVHRHVDELTTACSLPLDQRQQRSAERVTRRCHIRLVSTRTDGRDGVIVISATVEQATRGETDQVR